MPEYMAGSEFEKIHNANPTEVGDAASDEAYFDVDHPPDDRRMDVQFTSRGILYWAKDVGLGNFVPGLELVKSNIAAAVNAAIAGVTGQIASLMDSIQTNQDAIAAVQSRVTNNEGAIANLLTRIAALENNVPPPPPPPPPPPAAKGACCFADGSCNQLTAEDCAKLGGTYKGDNVSCLDAGCSAPPPPPTTGLVKGVLLYMSGAAPSDQVLAAIAASKTRWVRYVNFHLPQAQVSGGGWSFANKRPVIDQLHGLGLKILASVSYETFPAAPYTEWLSYVTALVTEFKGTIDCYSIANEPVASLDPFKYANFVRATAEVINAVDPSVEIIAGSFRSQVTLKTDWTKTVVQSPDWKAAPIKAVDFHVIPPKADPDVMGQDILNVAQALRSYGVTLPLDLTEVGSSSLAGWVTNPIYTDEDGQKAAASKLAAAAVAAGVRRAFWAGSQDGTAYTNPSAAYGGNGLFNKDQTPKLAAPEWLNN